MSDERAQYDLRLFAMLLGAGFSAALLCALLARIVSDSFRTNEAFVVGAVLALTLGGGYTWLAARRADMAKIVPIAILGVVVLFLPQELSDSRGNPEAMVRFWNGLPAWACLAASSGTFVWRQWWPVFQRWRGKSVEAVAEPAPRPQQRKSGPKPGAAKPRPSGSNRAPRPSRPAAPPPEADEPDTAAEEVRPPEPEGVRRSAITTGLPRRRKPE